jgi:hypothetical protein
MIIYPNGWCICLSGRLLRVLGGTMEEQLSPDEDEPEDAAPCGVDLDALFAVCREIAAEEAACAVRAARRGLPGGTPVADGRRGPGQPGSAVRRPGEFLSRAAGFGAGMALDVMPESWDESAAGEVAGVLAESRPAADAVLGLAHDLEV